MWVMTSVETLGYYRPSLRDDESQILAASNPKLGLCFPSREIEANCF